MSIRLENVSKVYVSGEVETHALKDVSLSFDNGEIVAILGPSGSGKSTLLNVCSGLDLPSSGTIEIDSDTISDMSTKELTKFRRDHLGFIFQQYNLLQTLNVQENVEVGRAVSRDPFATKEVIDQVGLTPNIDKYPYQLSGGEQQRVSIARAVVKKPKVLFCDEPTGALDEATAKAILTVLENLNKTYNTTICLITHNPNIAHIADRIVKLNSGEVTDIITNHKKRKAKDIDWG
ncbi:MAG: ABC transporter ATP-binding protein [Candidatus Izimaplasma sp.]|nr:ABC transporter ATP-binding protein [Candidatus Izimaplasma bacterium]